MKKFNINIVVLMLIMFGINLSGAMFQTVPAEKTKMVQKGADKIYCPSCGMHLGKFYKTNHIHKDSQYCSMHCLVENNQGKPPADAKVVDTKTLKQIKADGAYYVVGSKKGGTMTMNSKYAFEKKADAVVFQKKFSGKLMSYKEAFDQAKKDMQKDMDMIQTKRSKKVYKVGKKLYDKRCQKEKIDLSKFAKISELKSYIKSNNICKNIKKDKPLQAITVYLWDTQKLGISSGKADAIKVPKDAKCPVCGMFVSKYPKWAAVIIDDKKSLYFDGVKDMIKYMFEKNKKYSHIHVTDYYTTNAIEAQKAYYVLGSTVYGPMGDELIPFSTMEKAQAFKADHQGKSVIKFDQIDKAVLKQIDN